MVSEGVVDLAEVAEVAAAAEVDVVDVVEEIDHLNKTMALLKVSQVHLNYIYRSICIFDIIHLCLDSILIRYDDRLLL